MTRRLTTWLTVMAAAIAVAAIAVTLTVTTTAAWTDDVEVSAFVAADDWASSMGGIGAGNDTTVVDGFDWVRNDPALTCVDVRVTGTSATPERWQLTVDLSQRPFNGANAAHLNVQGGTAAEVDSLTATVEGTSGGGSFHPRNNNAWVTDSQVAQVQICHYNTPAPIPGHPDMYEVIQVDGPVEFVHGAYQACATLTATGLVTDLENDPFHYGWEASVDLTGVKAALHADGLQITHVQWLPPGTTTDFYVEPHIFNPPQDSYDLTSGATTALQGDSSVDIVACVRGQ